MTTDYTTHTATMCVRPIGDPIFSESAYMVHINDDAGGPYVKITSQADGQTISVDAECWHSLKSAVESMLSQCDAMIAESIEAIGRGERG